MGTEPGARLLPLALRAPEVPLFQPKHFATFFAVADTFCGRLSLTGRQGGGWTTSRRTYQDELTPRDALKNVNKVSKIDVDGTVKVVEKKIAFANK